MCQSIMKLDPAMRLQEKMDANDPLMKAMGYEGVWNPAAELSAKVRGEDTLVTQKFNKNGEALSIAHRNAAFNRSRVGKQEGHVMSIAAKRARG